MPGIQQMTIWQRCMLGGVCALMGGILIYSVFGDDGLIEYHRLREERRALTATNEDIGRQNLELYRVIERLSGDLDYIETMARHELGMVAPDEFIFKFEASRVPPRVVPDAAGAEGDGTP